MDILARCTNFRQYMGDSSDWLDMFLYFLFCEGYTVKDIHEISNCLGIDYAMFWTVVKRFTRKGLFKKVDDDWYFNEEPWNLSVYDLLETNYNLNIVDETLFRYFDIDLKNEESGIYGLYDEDKLIYIGRSVKIHSRFLCHLEDAFSIKSYNFNTDKSKYIREHWQNINFKVLESLPANQDIQKPIERQWIEKEQPLLNKVYITKKMPEGVYV